MGLQSSFADYRAIISGRVAVKYSILITNTASLRSISKMAAMARRASQESPKRQRSFSPVAASTNHRCLLACESSHDTRLEIPTTFRRRSTKTQNERRDAVSPKHERWLNYSLLNGGAHRLKRMFSSSKKLSATSLPSLRDETSRVHAHAQSPGRGAAIALQFVRTLRRSRL